MPELKFTIRSDADIFGKPRIYFASHPHDFEKYFKEITKLIFNFNDCVIFYKDHNADYSSKEYLNDIGEMQLLVVPITTNLLKNDENTIEDVRFAIKNRIPVLPIMEEIGLSELFNKIFPALQYVDKTSKDPTSISFAKKIEMFLSSVLISDDLSEKIRSAFDAYVFLSYRKKDREHAQKLMRLVHENPSCRDVAIWYDEFLIPGENFNHSIRRALCKSDLVLLAVTPNLINEHNYVEEVEYPMAKEEGKPILAVEMVPTDKGILTDRFKDIPSSTPAEADLISANMLLAIERIAFRKNNTPEHTYFIGLAYLSGIDVEVDFDKAVELITEAANAGLYDAVERLVNMYRSGIGVHRSYEIALEWENQKNLMLEIKYNEHGSFDDFIRFFESLVQNGDHARDLYRYDEAKEKYYCAISLIEKSGYYETSKYMLIDVYIKIGDVFREQMKYGDAQENYITAQNICEKTICNESFSENKRIRMLAACYDRLGDVMIAKGHSKMALESYAKALKCAENILREGNQEDRRLLADLYYSIGYAYFEDGRYEQAVLSVDKASAEIYSLLVKSVDFDLMRDLFKYDMLLWEIYNAEGDETSANHKAFSVLLCAEKLKEVFDDIESHRMYIEAQNVQCLIDKNSKYSKIENSVEKYEQILNYVDKYFKNVLTPSVLHNIIECSVNYAKTLKRVKKYKEAWERAKDTVDVALYSEKEYSSVRTKMDLANAYAACGNIAPSYESAKKSYEVAIEYYKELLSKTDLSGIKLSLIKAYNDLGVVLYGMNDKASAKEDFLNAKRMANEMLLNTSSAVVIREYISVLSNLRVSAFNEGKYEDALKYADESLEYLYEILSEINSIENRKRLVKILEGKALACKKLGMLELMNESLNLARSSSELISRMENNNDLDMVSSAFAVCDQIIRNGDYDSAETKIKEIFAISLDIDRKLLIYPTQLAMTLEKLARVCKLKGDAQNCEKYLEQAKLCRSGTEGENIVRSAWREPYACILERQINKSLRNTLYDYEFVKELANKIITARESIAADSDTPENKKLLAEILTSKAFILYNETSDTIGQDEKKPALLRDWGYNVYDVPESRECFMRAHTLFCELASERGTNDDMIALAKSYGHLESHVVKNIDEAEKFAIEKFNILKSIYDESLDEKDIKALAEVYYSLAHFYDFLKVNLIKAAALYEKCSEYYGELVSRFSNDKYSSSYENHYAIAKETYAKAGDSEGERRCREKIEKHLISEVTDLLDKINDAPTVEEWQNLISKLLTLGDNCDNDLLKKEHYYLRALDISKDFEHRIEIETASNYIAQCYLRLSDLYAGMGNLDKAIDCELSSVKKYDELVLAEPKKNYQSYKKCSLNRVSKLYFEYGDIVKSQMYSEIAETIKD